MRIRVKQQHIDNGETDAPEKCPMALAVREEVGGKDKIWVDGDSVEVYYTDGDGDWKEIYELDDAAQKFITDFDLGKTVQPFCVDVESCGEFDADADTF